MALHPAGFALPPTPYLVGILGLAALVAVGLWLARPDVNQTTIVAFAPWMIAGAALYALYQAAVFPPAVAPIFGSPVVYLSTFVLAGVVWTIAARYEVMAPVLLASVGGVVAVGGVGLAVAVGLARGTFAPVWPIAAVIVAAAIGGGVWIVTRRSSRSAADTGYAGGLVVFGHALDGVSTAVGYDVLGFGEQTPLSRIVLEIGAALPTASLLGAGWLFVVVKVGLAVALVVLLADLVREDPRLGYLALGVVAAVGLGPGAHNVVLFAIAG